MKDNIKVGDKPWTTVSYIEWKRGRIKEEIFYRNTKCFPLVTSDSKLLGSLDITMIGVADYYKVGEELGFKEVTLLGVSELSVEGNTEGNMIDFIEDSIGFSSLGIFHWNSEGMKERPLLGLKDNIK